MADNTPVHPNLQAFRDQQAKRAAKKAEEEQSQQEAAATARETAQGVFDALAEEAVFLVPEHPQHVRSRSHIGGLPRLPYGVAWPGGDWPLPFVAGIDLSELPNIGTPQELPLSGWLWFFCNIHDDCMTGAVLHSEVAASETEPPVGLPDLPWGFVTEDHPGVIKRTAVRCVPGRTLGNPGSRKEVPEVAGDACREVVRDAYEDAIAQEEDSPGSLVPIAHLYHQLVGGPCLIADQRTGADIQLLCLSGDRRTLGLSIGDGDVASFWIDPEDARQGRWDRITLRVGSR